MHRAALLALTLAFLPACDDKPASAAPGPGAAQAPEKKSTLRDNDPALAKKLVAEGGVLMDVRSPDEFGDKHLPNAVNIPVDEMTSRMADIEKLTGGDKKKPIVVYCHSGSRSRIAKRILVKAGYEQVTNLGSIDNWR